MIYLISPRQIETLCYYCGTKLMTNFKCVIREICESCTLKCSTHKKTSPPGMATNNPGGSFWANNSNTSAGEPLTGKEDFWNKPIWEN